MDVDDFTGNRFVMAGATLAILLVTGIVVQGFGTTSGAQERVALSADAGVPHASGSGGEAFASDGAEVEDEGRKQITTARIDIDVPDVQQAQTDIETLTSGHGGYVVSTSVSREFGDQGRMEVRVPDGNLSTFLTTVEGRWQVDSRQVDVRDVTRQYTELSLELRNKRQELQRLEELINRTDDVDTLIKIQERMGELRTRIQFLENELSQLEERITYATVTITMEESSAFETRFELRRALTESYRGMFKSLNLMIVGAGYLLPFVIIFLLVYVGRKKWHDWR